MGGRVGLKGTDGVVERARELGAEPSAAKKALVVLERLHARLARAEPPIRVRWWTCGGAMGADVLRTAGFDRMTISHEPAGEASDASDTLAAVASFVAAGVAVVLFCGGDGTARDVCRVTGLGTPILGIPAGVKMYSGVFGVTPARTADLLFEFLAGRVSTTEVDVLDLDEEHYRRGEWLVRLYDSARTPYEPSLVQEAKALITESSDRVVKAEIADQVTRLMEEEPGTLFLLGPGSTVAGIGARLGLATTLLGVDAVAGGKLVGRDLNEAQILALLDRYPACRLVLSPLGAAGFVLGRGNQQLSAGVVRRIRPENVIVVATPAKLARTPELRFDTGDAALDAELSAKGYLPVLVGAGVRRLVRVAA